MLTWACSVWLESTLQHQFLCNLTNCTISVAADHPNQKISACQHHGSEGRHCQHGSVFSNNIKSTLKNLNTLAIVKSPSPLTNTLAIVKSPSPLLSSLSSIFYRCLLIVAKLLIRSHKWSRVGPNALIFERSTYNILIIICMFSWISKYPSIELRYRFREIVMLIGHYLHTFNASVRRK